jgi:hypothetical protein
LEHDRELASSAFTDRASDLFGYNRTTLRSIARKPTDEILEFISQNPFWMTAVIKK